MSVQIVALQGIGDINATSDLASIIAEAATTMSWPDSSVGLGDGDVVVITSKVVSKAEGRVVPYRDAAHRESLIDAESVRLVARRGHTRIVETRHGLILAAAGIDESNTEPGTLVLLPQDPDASARALLAELQALTDKRLGVIITDSLGRAWRVGIVEHAIGAAGVKVLDDLRGSTDHNNRPLTRTIIGTADQLAAAAGTVVAKGARTPVVILRGTGCVLDDAETGAAALIRPADEDLFRTGSID